MKKKFTIPTIATGMLLGGAYFGVGNYFYNYALNAEKKKEFLDDNPDLNPTVGVDEKTEAAEQRADGVFLLNNQPEDIYLLSHDDLRLKLHANIYRNGDKNRKWALIVHGYGSQAAEMVRWIRGFHESGFQILAPDLRGHGNSEGDYIGMGWHDRFDVQSWINRIIAEDPQAEIVLFGISMGAATVMAVAGEELPENVKVIVEDCGYSTVSGVFSYQLESQFNLPPFPFLNAANTVTKMRAGYDLFKASPLKQVEKSETPILFIHGEKDNFVPFEMLDELYQAAPVEKEKLVIPEAVHANAVQVDPEQYWGTIREFVGRFIQ